MNAKKILYTALCIGGFGLAFVGLRIVGNALLGIGGIMLCIYGLLEVMHLFSTADDKPKSKSMYAAITPDEIAPPTPCPHCGAEVPAGNDFCGKCGNKIQQ